MLEDMALGSGVIMTTESGEILLFFEGESIRPACCPLPSMATRFCASIGVSGVTGRLLCVGTLARAKARWARK